MSTKTVLSVKVDKNVRDRAKKTAKELGVPLSLVVNRELERFANEKFLMVGTPSAKAAARLEILATEARADKNVSPTFSDVEDAIAWLKK